MAGKKKQVAGLRPARSMPNASERARNRASPKPVVKLYDHLSDHQKASIIGMDLGSMLDIKCNLLHNPLINWLGPLYDKHTKEFVIPGRGRIPLNADSVYGTLGLPRGDLPVRYAFDTEIEARLGPVIFPNHSSTPKITEVGMMLKEMTEFEDRFKQIWIMYLVCTLLCPTTCNKVSNRVYYIMDNFTEVPNMNLCQFVADKLHEELSADRLGGACLFHLQLLYVDSLDVSHLNIKLSKGPFVANRWSKKNIDTVLNADLKRDGSGYGNLELKAHLSINLKFFGGAAGFEQWIATNTAANCPKQRQENVARLIGDFASGMTGLLGKLVQGWTELNEHESTEMEQSLADLAHGVDIGASLDDAGAIKRAAVFPEAPSGFGSPSFRVPPVVQQKSVGRTRKMKSPSSTRPATRALSNENAVSTPLSPTTNSLDVSVSHVTRSAARLANSGQLPQKISILQQIQSVGNPSKSSPSPISAARVTRSASKALKLGSSLREGDDMLEFHSGVNYSNEASSDNRDDPDYCADDDDDDVDRYIIQRRDPVAQPEVVQVSSNIVDQAGLNVSGVDHLKHSGPSDDNIGDCPMLGKLGQTVSLNMASASSVSESENQTKLANNGKGVQVERQSGVDDHVKVIAHSPPLKKRKLDVNMVHVAANKKPTRSSPRLLGKDTRMIDVGISLNKLGTLPTQAYAKEVSKKNHGRIVGVDVVEKGVPSVKADVVSAPVDVIEAGEHRVVPGKSAVFVSSNISDIPAYTIAEQVKPGQPTVSHDMHVHSLVKVKRRRLRLVSKEDEKIKLLDGAKSCAAGIPTDVSPPMKQRKLDVKIIHTPSRVNVAANEKPTRSSPLLMSKDARTIDAGISVNKLGTLPTQAYAKEATKKNHGVIVADDVVKKRMASVHAAGSMDDMANDVCSAAQINHDHVGAQPVDHTANSNVPEVATMDGLLGDPTTGPKLSFHPDPISLAFPSEDDKSNTRHEEEPAVKIDVNLPAHARNRNDGIGDDEEIIYVTPVVPPPADIISVGSNTPRTKLRMARVVLPSLYMLPPYSRIISSEEEDKLYQQIIKHNCDCAESAIKNLRFLQIEPMWVYLWDLAGSVMPTGQLSNTVAEIGIAVLQENCPPKKIIFPWIVTVYLLERKFNSNVLKNHFRRDDKYQLSHQSLLSFAVLQELGTKEEPRGHWYSLHLNLETKRFEVLDSARGDDDQSLISHASSLVDAIKSMYMINYSESSKQIQDYELVYIDAPKQNNKLDCGFFMLKFLELWNGRVVPPITFEQIPELRKVLTWKWLNHPLNKLKSWKQLLDKNWL